jgi:hypothetical protein
LTEKYYPKTIKCVEMWQSKKLKILINANIIAQLKNGHMELKNKMRLESTIDGIHDLYFEHV